MVPTDHSHNVVIVDRDNLTCERIASTGYDYTKTIFFIIRQFQLSIPTTNSEGFFLSYCALIRISQYESHWSRSEGCSISGHITQSWDLSALDMYTLNVSQSLLHINGSYILDIFSIPGQLIASLVPQCTIHSVLDRVSHMAKHWRSRHDGILTDNTSFIDDSDSTSIALSHTAMTSDWKTVHLPRGHDIL